MKKVLLSVLFLGAATFANAQKSEIAEAKRMWGIFQFSMMQDPNAPKTNLPQQKVRTGPASTGGFGADGKADSKVGNTEAAASRAPRPVAKPAANGEQPKTFIEKQITSLNEGMSHADKAIANEKTKDMAEPYVYKALFASTIAQVDTVNLENSIQAEKMAQIAIEKAKALDTKGNEKENINLAEFNLRNTISGRGVRAYAAKDYNAAYTYFNQLTELNPSDTLMFMNTGLVASLAGKYPEAIKNFKKMIEFNVPDAKNYYTEIINITMNNLKDTTATLALIDEALVKYPDDPGYIGTATDIYVKRGEIEKSRAALNKLIAKDPSKPVYHYLMGNTYFTQALNLEAEKKKLSDKQKKEIDAMTVKITALVDQSIPFFKKSIELDPAFEPSLENLKSIYAFKSDTANYEAIKKVLDALPAKN